MASREEQTAALLKRLVSCVVTNSKNSQSAEAVKIRQRAFRYAVRIIGSRIATGEVGDEGTVAEAIKRKLVQNRPADSFTFSELHRKLMSLPTYQHRYELLRLLSIVSEDDQRTSTGNTSLGSTLLGAVTSGVLPKVSVDDMEGTADLAATTDSFARSRISVDGTSSVESSPQHRTATATSFGSGGLAVITTQASGLAPHKAVAYQEMSEIERTDFEISEAALVRDVIYCCQGIDGHHIRYSIKDDGYVVDQHVGVPASARELVRKLCELGWLFRRVRSILSANPVLPGPESAISSTASMAKTGSVAQAFGSAIQRELADFYRLMAVLEAQAHQGRPLPGKIVPGTGGQYLTLKRLVVWLAEPMQRMRLLAVLVDATHNRKGGGIAGALHQHTHHGDPFVHALTMRLTHQVCVPLFRMLNKWLFEGELQDTFGEFFVVADPSVEDKDLWYKKYCLSEHMLPPFISQELAGQILRTGKSINFMRLCCNDQGWAEASAAAVAGVSARGGLAYGQGSALESAVSEAARRIDERLMEILFKRFRFADHCVAIKRYLLLGQGDFIQSLLDLAGPDLNVRAHLISAYKMTGALEGAIRSSNAQFDELAQTHLRTKMMPHSGGEHGWEVFSLEYVVDMPLSTIFNAEAMEKYFTAFNFLWLLKRVEHALSASWQVMKPNQMAALERNAEGELARTLGGALRRCQSLRYEMSHFVTNLQYYLMFEVLEASWATFEKEMAAATDLDQLIAAHNRYLDEILKKSLLERRSEQLYLKLRTIFELVLRFRGLASRLHEAAEELAQKHLAAAMLAEERTRAGTWGSSYGDDNGPSISGFIHDDHEAVLEKLAEEYAQAVAEFLVSLPTQKHVDLRFLLFRLDFSEYYTMRGGGR